MLKPGLARRLTALRSTHSNDACNMGEVDLLLGDDASDADPDDDFILDLLDNEAMLEGQSGFCDLLDNDAMFEDESSFCDLLNNDAMSEAEPDFCDFLDNEAVFEDESSLCDLLGYENEDMPASSQDSGIGLDLLLDVENISNLLEDEAVCLHGERMDQQLVLEELLLI